MNSPEVFRYVPGTNEFLDRVYEGEPVWIINGPNGRLPIIAETQAEALARYAQKHR